MTEGRPNPRTGWLSRLTLFAFTRGASQSWGDAADLAHRVIEACAESDEGAGCSEAEAEGRAYRCILAFGTIAASKDDVDSWLREAEARTDADVERRILELGGDSEFLADLEQALALQDHYSLLSRASARSEAAERRAKLPASRTQLLARIEAARAAPHGSVAGVSALGDVDALSDDVLRRLVDAIELIVRANRA